MIIDLVNPFVQQMKYEREGDVIQELYLYSPDDNCIQAIKNSFMEEGFSVAVQKLVQEDETELTYILIDYVQEIVRAFRSITSHYEIFYYQQSRGGVILSDHMANMLSHIPSDERSVSIEGVCDSILYQYAAGKDTFVKNVYRLGYGETLEAGKGRVDTTLTQKLQISRYDLSGMDGSDVLEQSMREACGKMRKADSVNTLSGGVDSTLTQIVMGNPKSYSGCYSTEKFLHEKQYALESARMLGTDHTVCDIDMGDYMDILGRVAVSFGLPPYNITAQGLHLALMNEISSHHIMVGASAGAVYGQTMRTPYTEEKAEKYPLSSPWNYVNMNSEVAASEDFAYIERLFGRELVERQLAKRNEYVLERLQGFDTADTGKDNCLQFAHLIAWYAMNGTGVLEQMYNCSGKTVTCLFTDKKLVESFLSLPLKDRYQDSVYGEKPYAKRLLERLLPEYEVNKPKLGGSLPRTWMVTEGPMAGYFLEHDIPEFIDKKFYEDMRNPYWEVSWGVKYMILYSIWNENVMNRENPGHPSKYKVETVF